MTLSALQTVLWAVALAALLWSAATDLKERIIPDELAITAALCGFLLGLTDRPGQIWISILAAALIFLVLGVLCHCGVIGGGDVKLVAAAALLVRPEHIGELLAGIALAGGLLSCAYLAASYMLRAFPAIENGGPAKGGGVLSRWAKLESGRIASRKVPYGIAVLGGVIWYLTREISQCSSAISCLH